MKLTKSGRPDLRYKSSKTFEARDYIFWKKYGNLVAVAIMGFFAGVILSKTLWDIKHPKSTSPKPLGQTIQIKPIEVEAHETPCDFDAITYIRCRGEQLGYSNEVIMTAIRIARAESNFRPTAKNAKSSATGIFQFLWSTWDAYKCEGEKWNFVDNINCFYKLYGVQTERYAKKGLIYDFNDWNASRNKWDL